MQTLIRKCLPKASILSQLALMEQEAWMSELAARKVARPLPVKPSWV